ncbi:MAG: hypothetical protein FWD15_01275 [Alphaproteobacteria bacterium]|nr:hypothetical protein [Alphaproteobacteria bacterium]
MFKSAATKLRKSAGGKWLPIVLFALGTRLVLASESPTFVDEDALAAQLKAPMKNVAVASAKSIEIRMSMQRDDMVAAADTVKAALERMKTSAPWAIEFIRDNNMRFMVSLGGDGDGIPGAGSFSPNRPDEIQITPLMTFLSDENGELDFSKKRYTKVEEMENTIIHELIYAWQYRNLMNAGINNLVNKMDLEQKILYLFFLEYDAVGKTQIATGGEHTVREGNISRMWGIYYIDQHMNPSAYSNADFAKFDSLYTAIRADVEMNLGTGISDEEFKKVIRATLATGSADMAHRDFTDSEIDEMRRRFLAGLKPEQRTALRYLDMNAVILDRQDVLLDKRKDLLGQAEKLSKKRNMTNKGKIANQQKINSAMEKHDEYKNTYKRLECVSQEFDEYAKRKTRR